MIKIVITSPTASGKPRIAEKIKNVLPGFISQHDEKPDIKSVTLYFARDVVVASIKKEQ